jgi:hypothetical protein
MHRMLKACQGIYWLALALWVSALVAGGVAAAGVFSVLPKLGLTLQRFEGYDHAEHGRLAGGMVMEPIFTTIDIAQAVVIVLVIMMLLLQLTLFRQPLRRPANVVRTICIAAAAALFVVRVATVTPSMNRELRAYWAAAEASRAADAAEHREAFDALHPVTSRMFNATLLLLLVAVAASAAASVPPAPVPHSLQTPQLLQRR